MSTQHDFGRFDPAFPGVSIHFSNVDAARTFDAYRKGAVPVAHLPPDERFQALSLASVVSHELRHFHDALLSPYGARIFRHRVQMLVNLMESLTYIFDRRLTPDANCLPVPLARWWKLEEDARQRWLHGLPRRSDGRRWIPVAVPLFEEREVPLTAGLRERRTLQSFDDLLHAVTKARQQIEDLTFNAKLVRGESSFQPWQVFELSALLVQLQDVWQGFGAEDLQFFIGHLTADPRNPYGRMLRVSQALCEAAVQEFNWAVASVITTWCLLGSYASDDWDACPSMRFVKLWGLIHEEGLDLDGDLMSLYDDWSERLGVSTVAEGIAEARRMYEAIPAALEQQLSSVKGSFVADTKAELLIRVTKAIARSSDAMAAAFFDEPDSYVVPYHYHRSQRKFVIPGLRLVFEGTGMAMEETVDELQQKHGWVVQWALEGEKGGTVILSYVEPLHLGPIHFIDYGDAASLADLFGLTEFVFSEMGHERGDVQRAGRVFFRDAPVEPVQVY